MNHANLATRFPDVYALGDVSALPMAKAGVFAEAAAAVVADDIAARLRGEELQQPYEGAGSCYIEFGGGMVGKVEANFLGGPAPTAARRTVSGTCPGQGNVRLDSTCALVWSLISTHGLDRYEVRLSSSARAAANVASNASGDRRTDQDPERFRGVLPPGRFEEFLRGAEEARTLLAGRTVWNVNSTARGGGVVELLRPLIGYARGVDARWVVIDGSPAFYDVTKRIHNRLHGFDGDGGPLDGQARRIYEDTLAENAAAFAPRVRPGDVVILHDPQSAGMAPALRPVTAALIWRCHVGVDEPNDLVRETWSFLQPYVRRADVCVFSRDAFVWEGLHPDRVAIITPTIDVFTPKNEDSHTSDGTRSPPCLRARRRRHPGRAGHIPPPGRDTGSNRATG